VNDADTALPDILQAGLEIKPLGDDAIRHVLSARLKPDPDTVTTVPTGPEVGESTITMTVKDALALSPDDPVTVTVYVPLPVPETVKEPDTTPAETVHAGLDMRPLGDEEIVHVVSPLAKFEPETETVVPRLPDVGDNAIDGLFTVNVNEVAAVAAGLPFTVTV
jgi:hypothetical protein